MPDTITIKKHARLVDRMANALGLDLEQEVLEGRLDSDLIPDMVLGCTGCTDPERCESWLASQSETAQHPREGCKNRQVFEILKSGHRV